MDSLWQFINLLLTADAYTLTTSLNDVTYIEVYLFGLQLQVATKVLIYLLHHASPLGVTSIGLALMHQDTLDDTVLLSLLGQLYHTLIRVIIISLKHTLHPAWSLLLGILLDTIGQESFDINTTDSYMNHTNLDILWQRSHHGTTKPVGRCQTCVRTAERSRSLTPLTHLTGWALSCCREVNSRHQQETRTWACQVSSFRTSIALHI